MKLTFKANKISEHVYWVGAIDWSLRNFHGYATERGSSYNAYLIIADKVTLIDTVKRPFKDEMLSRISSVIDPSKISYIVSNHSEMDHSGCLPDVLDIIRPERVFASTMGEKALKAHFGDHLSVTALKNEEKVPLGNMDLDFIEARMVHWPDSMFSYLKQDKVLFTNDAFGMHLATSQRCTDECESDIVNYEAKKYFANILTPFAHLIPKVLDKVDSLGFKIDILATDHGPIWRKNIKDIITKYRDWSEMRSAPKAVVVYDTMWGSTDKMARSISDGIISQGISTKLMPIDGTSRADIATEVLDAGALVVGSPTLNNNIFPTVADVITYLKGLKFKNLIGASFGSYGWSGEALKQLSETLSEMKIELVGEGINVNYVPQDRDLENCFALGFKIGERLKANSKN